MTPIGNEIEKSIRYINENYDGVKMDKYVIMPNHIHFTTVIVLSITKFFSVYMVTDIFPKNHLPS